VVVQVQVMMVLDLIVQQIILNLILHNGQMVVVALPEVAAAMATQQTW
jgi:hypothetical protein